MARDDDPPRSTHPLTFDYFDASDDPRAAVVAATPPAVLDALESLGCVPVGHALAVLRGHGIELVTPVWRSADGRAQVELEARNGRADLTTLFSDGTVVKTIQRPPLWTWLHAAPGVRHHPRDRHECAAFVGTLAGIMARHRARVAALESDARAVVPIDGMRVHIALRQRAAELRDARTEAQLGLALVGALVLAGVVGVALSLWLGGRGVSTVGALLLPALAALLVGMPAHYALKWFVAPVLVRMRPGPPPRPAAVMIARAAVEARRLRREG